MGFARYSRLAMLLHWALALGLAFQLALGWRLEELEGLAQFSGYQLHKTVGITILLLSLLRLALRLTRRPPAAFTDNLWARRLAGAVHWGLYLVMIGAPLTGWLIVSTARIQVPTLVFGIIPWPHLPVPAGVHDPAEALHALLALLAIGLFVLHILGALRHQFIKREQLLPRMMPIPTEGRSARPLAAVAMLLALGALFAASSLGWFVSLGGRAQPAAQASIPEPAVPVLGNEVAPTGNAMEEDPLANQAAVAEADAADWRVRPGGSLGFAARWNADAINGSFGRWTAEIHFGSEALEDSKIDVKVDLASVDTGDGQRDDTLRSSNFFDVATHPQARFRSTSLRHLGGQRYRADGTLELHGQRRPVSLAFTLMIEGNVATARGTANLKRTDFGVGSGEWAATDVIADGVAVNFSFKADRED